MTGKELKSIDSGTVLVIGGKEYEIVLDFNAICELEEKYGSFEKATEMLNTISGDFSQPGMLKNIRYLLYLMLLHSDPDITEIKVGSMLTMNNMQEVMNALGRAMNGTKAKKAGSPQEK